MSETPFRRKSPKRTYTGPTYSNYQKYKAALAKDFNNRCGYTDCSDFWFGGSKAFHIDHFKPKSIHGHLTNDYSNLVYACSHVNQAKSDDDSNYIDPCDEDYNQHFRRDTNGNIIPLDHSVRAIYMFTKLKLYLKRYSIIWTLEVLEEKIRELGTLLDSIHEESSRLELLEQYQRVVKIFFEYKDYLAANQ